MGETHPRTSKEDGTFVRSSRTHCACGFPGAIGFTTNLDPSMTLATGGIGGGVFSENITVRHVLNIKRLAWGVREWSPETAAPAMPSAATAAGLSDARIEEIVRRVMAELRR